MLARLKCRSERFIQIVKPIWNTRCTDLIWKNKKEVVFIKENWGKLRVYFPTPQHLEVKAWKTNVHLYKNTVKSMLIQLNISEWWQGTKADMKKGLRDSKMDTWEGFVARSSLKCRGNSCGLNRGRLHTKGCAEMDSSRQKKTRKTKNNVAQKCEGTS